MRATSPSRSAQPSLETERLGLSPARVAWVVYALLSMIALAEFSARVAAARSASGATPFFSANDRSRFLTIRALVEFGTYQVDAVIVDPRTGKFDPEWQSIDLVRHAGADGKQHYYSSKPPLYPTMLAGVYWLVKTATGATLADEPLYAGRLVVWLAHAPQLVLYLALLAWLVERRGGALGGRLFVFAVGSFGTFVTTFGVSLNNHLPAAVGCLAALAAAWPVWNREHLRFSHFALAGLAAAWTAANELPALALAAALLAALAWRSWWRALVGFVPAAAVVAAAFFYTNYQAHQTWRPAYSWRNPVGDHLADVTPLASAPPRAGPLGDVWRSALRDEAGLALSPRANLAPGRGDHWVLRDDATETRYVLVRQADRWAVHAWGDWYDYPGSYWIGPKKGVDQGEPSRAAYLLHCLVGHHGWFSLTPAWLLGLFGAALAWQGGSRGLALATLGLTALVLAFYVSRPLIDRNYGGVSCCLRWMIWLTPLWLACLLSAADWLGQRAWGWLALGACLAASVFSASHAAGNPWRNPWLYEYWAYLGYL